MTSAWMPAVATIALLAGTMWMDRLAADRIPEPLAIPLERIDRSLGPWSAVSDQELPPRVMKSLAPADYLSRKYQNDGTQIDLLIVFYAQQRAGESMHSPKHCLPGGGWEIWKQDAASVSAGGRQYEINQYSIQNGGNRLLMYYWYQSPDRIIASEYKGKILLARDTLLTGRTAGSIVRFTLRDAPDARLQGLAFASLLIPKLHLCFRGA